jgi:hypothetical protein
MKSIAGGLWAWTARVVTMVGLCLCAAGLLPAAAAADGVAAKGLPKSESELRAVEEKLLGADHAAAHASQRKAEKTARFSSDAGSQMLSETTLSGAATLAGAAPADVGEWSSVFPLRRSGDPTKSVPAIHAAVLPTGKVIWFGYRLDDGVRYKTESFAVLFDPVTKQIEDVPPPNDPRTGKPVALYCGGMSLLPDGRLLVTGGYLDYHTTTTGVAAPNAYSGLNQVWTFDPYTKRWQRHEDMGKGRWYPTQMLMPDGRTMIVQGLDTTGEDYNRQVEVFDPRKPIGQEIDLLDRELTTAQDGDYYPHMFWMPSGRGLLAGPERVQSYFIAAPAPLTFRTTDFADPLRRRTWGAGCSCRSSTTRRPARCGRWAAPTALSATSRTRTRSRRSTRQARQRGRRRRASRWRARTRTPSCCRPAGSRPSAAATATAGPTGIRAPSTARWSSTTRARARGSWVPRRPRGVRITRRRFCCPTAACSRRATTACLSTRWIPTRSTSRRTSSRASAR